MGKTQAKSIFRLLPLIDDLGRLLWAFTLNKGQQGSDMTRLCSLFGLSGKLRRERLICKKAFPVAVNLGKASRGCTF